MTQKISLDQPLLDQFTVREILFPVKEGLIPNLILKRVLKITRILIQDQLKQNFTDYELTNLVVGYDVFSKNKNGEIMKQEPKKFSVEWVDLKISQELQGQKEKIEDPVLRKFISTTFTSLRQLISGLTPNFIQDNCISLRLLVTIQQKISVSKAVDFRLSEGASGDGTGTRTLAFTKDCLFCNPLDIQRQYIQDGDCTGEFCP